MVSLSVKRCDTGAVRKEISDSISHRPKVAELLQRLEDEGQRFVRTSREISFHSSQNVNLWIHRFEGRERANRAVHNHRRGDIVGELKTAVNLEILSDLARDMASVALRASQIRVTVGGAVLCFNNLTGFSNWLKGCNRELILLDTKKLYDLQPTVVCRGSQNAELLPMTQLDPALERMLAA